MRTLKNLGLIAGFALILMTVFSCRKYPLPHPHHPGDPGDTVIVEPPDSPRHHHGDTAFCFFRVEVEVDTAASSATANPQSGTAPYEYRWSNGETTQTITIEHGAYFVVVKDSKGCKGKGAAYIR